MRFVLPVLLLLSPVGFILGIIVGAPQNPDPPTAQDLSSADRAYSEGRDGSEIVKLNNQFVVPVLADGNVSSLIIVSLSIETIEGAREEIFLHEARVRDALLTALFDHANSGYFTGVFTDHKNLDSLRASLTEKANSVLTVPVYGILITDLVRQDKI